MTEDLFCVASEAGVFGLDEATIVGKGTLRAGSGAAIDLAQGTVRFDDPSRQRNNEGAVFDARLIPIGELPALSTSQAELAARLVPAVRWLPHQALFGFTTEERDRVLRPMVEGGKEPIGSMGDTARPAIFSDLPWSFYDFFYQRFAQVTNPPLDYLRESVVTDLQTYLGIRPNVLDPKQLIPPAPGILLERPVLSLAQMQLVESLITRRAGSLRIRARILDITFDGTDPERGLREALGRIEDEAVAAVRGGCSILVLSHRAVSADRPPIPSLLALRAVVCILNRWGARLRASVVVEAGDIRTTHALACAIGFGATAVCPRLTLEQTRELATPPASTPDQCEERAIEALCQGLLKVMSKMGISVARSYHSSKLFSAYGLGPKLMSKYFDRVSSPLGGLELRQVADAVVRAHHRARTCRPGEPLESLYRLREKVKGDAGEMHSMTAARAKLVHHLVRDRRPAAQGGQTEQEIYDRYLELGERAAPTSPRHLVDLRPAERALPLDEVEPASAILRRFGSGAMSFGAISAESQRDIFIAMRNLGGRCNSGEGGENPYYYLDGTTATTKQIASARFGVTAEYLVCGSEIEIKVAQGAKPGEGGQLMGVKVDEHIARARHATPGVDLISPPPLHDIYSIEDLKELIYELKQLTPDTAVCVKLVAGDGIGTIAVGVAKAGADVIQISGGDGGTGAASLSSMRHAGLPWELGLIDAHQALVEHSMRDRVRLRIDGGLSSPKDVVLAALLGADEYGFGKLLLVAAGCIMARICEKNRCPTGIATHDPKFKAKYKGQVEHVETLLRRFADEVRKFLATIGVHSLDEAIGQRRHLRAAAAFSELVEARGLDLAPLLRPVPYVSEGFRPRLVERSRLNRLLIDDLGPAVEAGAPIERSYAITNVDRAVLAGISGVLAMRSHRLRMADLDGETPNRKDYDPAPGTARLEFVGSAGQGFGAFLVEGFDVILRGEANDAVCKSMSGGRVVIVPPRVSTFAPAENVIIGNCALYGATGGTVFVSGRAGDRFAVRNSGAQAVVEGTGLHCCEYMTGGVVVVLGPISFNAGAGMTGGLLYLRRDQCERLNPDYVHAARLSSDDEARLTDLLTAHAEATGSAPARALLEDRATLAATLRRVEPRPK
jgi:glutamate synthase domain-containing protein 2/glutamate synthase domain-containing protein 3